MNVLEFNTEQRMSDMERTFHASKVKQYFYITIFKKFYI